MPELAWIDNRAGDVVVVAAAFGIRRGPLGATIDLRGYEGPGFAHVLENFVPTLLPWGFPALLLTRSLSPIQRWRSAWKADADTDGI